MYRWLIVGCLCVSFAGGAAAEEKHRQLGPHEHGHGRLNIAFEGKRVSMELEAPGVDIVGFEHEPSTKEQNAALAEAKERLRKISNVIGLPAAAGCKQQKATIKLHKEDEDHADHKHDDKTEAEQEHSEFHVVYELNCATPTKIDGITFPYFKNFTGTKGLEVNVVGPKSQKKFEVRRDSAKIGLGGVI
jgi:Protein of unknown function (DUF2796)